MYIPEEEKQYLAYALEKVQEELDKHDTDQEVITRDLYEKRKYLWQELVGAERAIQDQYERTMQETDIIAGEKSLSENQLQVERLKKMLDSPYFARIDFQEEDEYDSETFYIGKFGLTDLEFFEQIICDWRSDVASVYYNYEPGPAAYQCPNGEIPGELKSKRQFQIERGEMLGCFDTSVSIGDRFLQRVLSGHAGEQMKTIVDSIQQKQNEIIRDTDHSVVVLNGCAGSGKTSIALHRIAYLMYHARNTLSAADCIIFSPNSLFEDYIASVLPDLGEDKVWQTTFADFATGVLGGQYEVRSFLEAVSDDCEQHIRAKGSKAFAGCIRACLEKLEAAIRFEDVYFEGKLIASAARQEEIFRTSRKNMSYRASIERVKVMICHEIRNRKYELRSVTAERLVNENGANAYLSKKDLLLHVRLACIRTTQRIVQAFRSKYLPDPVLLYADLLAEQFGEAEKQAFLQRKAEQLMYFEDAAPLLYLMVRLGLLNRMSRMRQVIIDEAQDYTELQYMLLLEMYPHARFTVLGDPAQSLSGEGHFLPALLASGRTCAQYELDINYRSSKEIVEFTNALAGATLCRSVDRSAGPVIEKCVSMDTLTDELNDFMNQGGERELAAIVCADGADCEAVYRALHRKDTCLLVHEFAARNQRICVLPAALAKGLEFDRVAVVDVDGKLTGNRLYVACTRALHQLALYHV
jgi:DNA helicase-2/ATP-dependent DNA helicase PcrA